MVVNFLSITNFFFLNFVYGIRSLCVNSVQQEIFRIKLHLIMRVLKYINATEYGTPTQI